MAAPAPAADQDAASEVAFRETMLGWFSPEHAAALRHIGDLLHGAVIEHGTHAPDTAGEVRAALADLRYLARFLAGVGREYGEDILDLHESDLSRLAETIAPELARLAGLLEAGLGAAEALRAKLAGPEALASTVANAPRGGPTG